MTPTTHSARALLEWQGHLLLLHTSAGERERGLTAWVRCGLERDEKIIYVEGGTAGAEDSFEAILERHGIDAGAARHQGRVARMSPGELYGPGGIRAAVETSLAQGFPGVRLTAEHTAARRFLDRRGHLAAERVMEETCRVSPVSALCRYRRSLLDDPYLTAVVATHLTGIREHSLRSHPRPGGLGLAGEIDMTNEDVLGGVAGAAAARSEGSLVLDLTEVSFLSVGGIRALCVQTSAFREQGGTVRILTASPVVERPLRLLRVHEFQGMEIAPSPG